MNTAMIKPQWGPLSIALMVLGFVIWWPLGLAALAYILWGEMFGGSSDKAERFVHRSRSWAENCGRGNHGFRHGGFRQSSGNAAFDDYKKAGRHTACVKVVDVFGCDTSITVELRV